jgi:hypothetical protein
VVQDGGLKKLRAKKHGDNSIRCGGPVKRYKIPDQPQIRLGIQ